MEPAVDFDQSFTDSGSFEKSVRCFAKLPNLSASGAGPFNASNHQAIS